MKAEGTGLRPNLKGLGAVLQRNGYTASVSTQLEIRPSVRLMKIPFGVLALIVLALFLGLWFHLENPDAEQFIFIFPWLLVVVMTVGLVLFFWMIRMKVTIFEKGIVKRSLFSQTQYGVEEIVNIDIRYQAVNLPRSTQIRYHTTYFGIRLQDDRIVHLFHLDAETIEACSQQANIAAEYLGSLMSKPFIERH